MAPFTVSKSLVEVELEYIEIGEDNIFVVTEDLEEEARKKYGDKIKTAKAKFARPGWKNFNSYLQGCLRNMTSSRSLNDENEFSLPIFDTTKLRENKFRVLLRELIDGNGEQVPLSPDFLENVMPEFAIALIDQYDKKLEDERLSAIKKSNLISLEEKEEKPEEKKEEKPEEKKEA